jgi:hypothetical protein
VSDHYVLIAGSNLERMAIVKEIKYIGVDYAIRVSVKKTRKKLVG